MLGDRVGIKHILVKSFEEGIDSKLFPSIDSDEYPNFINNKLLDTAREMGEELAGKACFEPDEEGTVTRLNAPHTADMIFTLKGLMADILPWNRRFGDIYGPQIDQSKYADLDSRLREIWRIDKEVISQDSATSTTAETLLGRLMSILGAEQKGN